MLITHTNIPGQMSFAQPQGVTLRDVLTQGGTLHTHTTRKGCVTRPWF